jgi:hypothetical protein
MSVLEKAGRSRWASPEIARLLWKLDIHCRVYKSLRLLMRDFLWVFTFPYILYYKLKVYASTLRESVYTFTHIHIHLRTYRSTHLFIYLPTHPHIYPPTYPPIYLSTYLLPPTKPWNMAVFCTRYYWLKVKTEDLNQRITYYCWTIGRK